MVTEYKAVEHLVGRGQLSDADAQHGEFDYEVTIYEGWLADGRGGRIKGIGLIEGSLLGADPNDLFDLLGKDLVLRLEEGRRWRCFLQSSIGRLENAGGFESE